MKKIFLLTIVALISLNAMAQEFQFDVTINTPKLQTADPKVFKELETAMESFLNNTKFTDDSYEPNERIKGKIQLTIREELSATDFAADFAIQASRPIYNSDQETSLINHLDKDFIFRYEQFQPIEFNRNVYVDNMSSILGFYVFFILGLDYDSFAPLGGEPHFQSAQEVIATIPTSVSSSTPGWTSLEKGNRNRYWMIENALSPRVKPFREAMYTYHRGSLDKMHEDPMLAKSEMMKAMENVSAVGRAYPNCMIIQMFVNSKSEEIIEIFKKGTAQEKSQIFKIMTKIDASKASKYRAIGL